MALPDSQIALEFFNYQDEIRRRATDILAAEGFAVEDGDTIVDVLKFAVDPRTEAAISGFLEDNGIQDRDESTDAIIEELYRSGIRMHALVSYLGQNGIRLVAQGEDGSAEHLILGTLGDIHQSDNDAAPSMLALVIDAVQESMGDESEQIDEHTDLTSDDEGTRTPQVQHVGMFAIHRAILDLEKDITHSSEGDLMNRGAQLICILASVQGAKGKLFFVDRAGIGLPLVDDINDIAKGPYLDADAEDSTGE